MLTCWIYAYFKVVFAYPAKTRVNALSDFLKRLVAKLSEAEIPFMLVGSVAAGYHGHPRSTLDIDAVVDADEETL